MRISSALLLLFLFALAGVDVGVQIVVRAWTAGRGRGAPPPRLVPSVCGSCSSRGQQQQQQRRRRDRHRRPEEEHRQHHLLLRRPSGFSLAHGRAASACSDDDGDAGDSDHHRCDDGCAGITNSTSSTSSSSSPQWRGSTYSWTPPPQSGGPRRKRRRRKAVANGGGGGDGGSAAAVVESVHLDHCGTVEIEQIIDDGDPDDCCGDGDGDGSSSKRTTTTTTGFVLWSAAYSLAEYVDAQCRNVGSWKKGSSTGRRISCLELGAGLGLPTIVAARHGMRCVATEADPLVLPLLRRNVRNNLPGDDSASAVSVEVLDWAPAAEAERRVWELCAQHGGSPDLILASDLIYGATRPVWQELLSVICEFRKCRQRQQGQQQQRGDEEAKGSEPVRLERFDGTLTPASDPLVLLGYTQRRRDMGARGERDFFRLLHQMGMEPHPIPFDRMAATNSDRRLLTTIIELRWRNETNE